jgi:DNA-binding response OmpR family regulator
MTTRRVLLVEDDASLRRFVRLALEDLPLELLECDRVADALGLLSKARVDLIVTDLMLPGQSGLDLLQQLQREPGLRGNAGLVVFSAGLTLQIRGQLAALGVWRLIAKPASVTELLDCVRDGLADRSIGENGAGSKEADGRAEPASPVTIDPSVDEETTDALDLYFDGNRELFDAYRAACRTQFPRDIRAGDDACAGRDGQTLLRVAHSLKTVLLTLGYASLSRRALEIEQLCRAGDLHAAAGSWSKLSTGLRLLGQLD